MVTSVPQGTHDGNEIQHEKQSHAAGILRVLRHELFQKYAQAEQKERSRFSGRFRAANLGQLSWPLERSGVAVQQESGHSDAAGLHPYNHVRDVSPPTDGEENGIASCGLAADSCRIAQGVQLMGQCHEAFT